VRVPTEAEWEHACRAGTRTTYYTGDLDADLDRAGWYGANSGGKTHPVGEKAQNAWGVHDMHGNVWEWCADWYEDYGAESATDPQGPTEGQGRVLRGGSWGYDPGLCRSARRNGINPDNRNNFIGFRVVWLGNRKGRSFSGVHSLVCRWPSDQCGMGEAVTLVGAMECDPADRVSPSGLSGSTKLDD
jgi:formylglycine-generating enzyme required for sulfatase activity